MTPERYKTVREQLGTQSEVAEMLDVHKQTISNRERGRQPIDLEAEFAIRYLASANGRRRRTKR